MLTASTTDLRYPATEVQHVATFSSLPASSPPLPSTPSIPSPSDNTPTCSLTPQLGCRSIPIVEKDNDADSEIDYHSSNNSGNNKENQPPCAPVSFIPNILDSLLFYPIYVRNPAYHGPRDDNNFTPGCEQQVILAPFIKYSTDYTHVFSTLGEGQEVRSLSVQVGKRVKFPRRLTAAEWKHLEAENEREFAINVVLTEINDPRLMGEIARYRGYAKLKTTLDGFLKEANEHVCTVMAEAVKVDEELKKCKQHLELAGAYHEIANHFNLHFPLPTPPRQIPIQSPLLAQKVGNGNSASPVHTGLRFPPARILMSHPNVCVSHCVRYPPSCATILKTIPPYSATSPSCLDSEQDYLPYCQ